MKKKSAFVVVAMLAGACASSTADKPGRTLDERQARIEREQAAEAAAARESTTVAGDDAARDSDADGNDGTMPAEPVRTSTPDRDARALDSSRSTDTDADINPKPSGVRERDNTGVNERDRDSAAMTPLDQSSDSRDIDITQAIRKLVIAADDLSFNAKNVKIITVNGKVTLRGPVQSANERTTIESSARSVPGVTQIDNQIEVKK